MVFMPFFNTDSINYATQLNLNITLALGFLTMIGITKVDFKYKLISYKVNNGNLIKFFLLISLLFLLYVLYQNWSILNFANPLDSSEVIAQRLFKDTNISNTSQYLINWLVGAFAPIFLVYGLLKRKTLIIVYAFTIILLLYTINANKIFLLALPISFFLFKYFEKKRTYFGPIVTGTLIVLMLLAVALVYNFENTDFYLPALGIFQMVLIRTVGISTYNYKYYYDFFIVNDNPKTYLSHLNVVEKFTNLYPYKTSLGQVIGDYYFNNSSYQLNSNFFITDGLCGFGLIGFILAGFFTGSLLNIVDSSAKKHSLSVSVALTFYSTMNLANVSVFTTFLTSGLVIVIFYMFQAEETNLQ